MILPPTSQIGHHHKVTNVTMSPTSLSPLFVLLFKGTILTGIFPHVSVAILRLVFGIYKRILGEI